MQDRNSSTQEAQQTPQDQQKCGNCGVSYQILSGLLSTRCALPYEYILEVDPIGDIVHSSPHLYCRFDGEVGPYIGPTRLTASRELGWTIWPKAEDRRPLFDAAIKSRDEEARYKTTSSLPERQGQSLRHEAHGT